MSEFRVGDWATRARVWDEPSPSAPRKEISFSDGDVVVGSVEAHKELVSALRAELVSALRAEIHGYLHEIQSALSFASAHFASDIERLSQSQAAAIANVAIKVFSAAASALNIGGFVAGALVDTKIAAVTLGQAPYAGSPKATIDAIRSKWSQLALAIGRAGVERVVTDEVVERVHAKVCNADDWRRAVREIAPTVLGLPPDPAHRIITEVVTEIYIRRNKFLATLKRHSIHRDTIAPYRQKASAEATELLASIRNAVPANVRRVESEDVR